MKWFVILIIGICGAVYLLKHRNVLFEPENSPGSVSLTKCVTASGEVIYGEAPPDIECRTSKPILNSVKVVNRNNLLDTNSIPNLRCDGRQYCSQMRSCEEARFFLANCPDTRMDGDGDGDGRPCESQWCN